MENLVNQGTGTRFIKIREDLIRLTGNPVSSMILDSFIQWTNHFYKKQTEKGIEKESMDLSFTRTYFQIISDCFGMFGKNVLSKELSRLEELGYIQRIIRDSDFKTNRYLVNIEKINADLEREFGSVDKEKNKEEKKNEPSKEKEANIFDDNEQVLCDKFIELSGIKYKDNDETWNNPIKSFVEDGISPDDLESAIDSFRAAKNKNGESYILTSPKSIISFVKSIQERANRKSKVRTVGLDDE